MKRRRQRLYERDSKKNLYLSIFGIIFVLFLVFKFGIPLLVNFSLLVSGDSSTETEMKTISFVSSPILDPLPEATNSAEIIVSGKSVEKAEIELFINDELADKTSASKDGRFEFEQILLEGSNKIYVRAEHDEKKSDFSQSFDVIFDGKAPELSISSPSDGQSFGGDQNRVNVSGTTEENARVTVNGFWAIVNNNSFSYNLPLQNGENTIKVSVSDLAGNKTEKEIKVTYSP